MRASSNVDRILLTYLRSSHFQTFPGRQKASKVKETSSTYLLRPSNSTKSLRIVVFTRSEWSCRAFESTKWSKRAGNYLSDTVHLAAA